MVSVPKFEVENFPYIAHALNDKNYFQSVVFDFDLILYTAVAVQPAIDCWPVLLCTL